MFFVSSTVNPILYNLMSIRYRQAFKETMCCCFLEQPTSRRSTMEYTYIKSRNRSRSTDLPSYFKNGTIRRSDDRSMDIHLLQKTLNNLNKNGSETGSDCPTCKYGSSKDLQGSRDSLILKKMYLADNAMKFSRIGTHV